MRFHSVCFRARRRIIITYIRKDQIRFLFPIIVFPVAKLTAPYDFVRSYFRNNSDPGPPLRNDTKFLRLLIEFCIYVSTVTLVRTHRIHVHVGDWTPSKILEFRRVLRSKRSCAVNVKSSSLKILLKSSSFVGRFPNGVSSNGSLHIFRICRTFAL